MDSEEYVGNIAFQMWCRIDLVSYRFSEVSMNLVDDDNFQFNDGFGCMSLGCGAGHGGQVCRWGLNTSKCRAGTVPLYFYCTSLKFGVCLAGVGLKRAGEIFLTWGESASVWFFTELIAF